MSETIARTTAGPVIGVRTGDVRRFLGVPYAAAPVGDLRFAPPAAPIPWSTPRQATEPGPTAPQRSRAFPGLDLTPLIGTGWRPGDDYLTANVWAPLEGGPYPVMVFIHGGGFLGGCADASAYDGAAFARSGVVLVSISHRVGVDGFAPIPGGATNCGLRDLLAGLVWVRDNAGAFGGDPANMTVFGELSGAMCIADLVASPPATGLFRRAIVQSGHGSLVRPLGASASIIERLAEVLEIAPTFEAFRGCGPEACIQAVVALVTEGVVIRDAEGRDAGYGAGLLRPVYGDDVLPAPPLEALAAGAGAGIDILIGANTHESNLTYVATGLGAMMDGARALASLSASEPAAAAILTEYGLGRSGVTPGAALAAASTDLMFRLPARRFALAHQGRSHVYEFGWSSPAMNGALGACHGLELPFVFDNLAACAGPEGLVGPSPPQQIADRIHGLWVNFARHGTLPWPVYEPSRRLIGRIDTGETLTDPEIPAARHV